MIHPEQHHGLPGDEREEPAVVRPFQIIDPAGTILIDEFDDPLCPFAIIPPKATGASHL
jgi:hypothetical protein